MPKHQQVSGGSIIFFTDYCFDNDDLKIVVNLNNEGMHLRMKNLNIYRQDPKYREIFKCTKLAEQEILLLKLQ